MVMNGHNHGDVSGKSRGCEGYIQALEEERRKIQVFQRELPLCLELVTQAIDSCKQQLSGTTAEYNFNGQSECNSDQTSTQTPVFEEFIPIKTTALSEEHELSNGDEHKKSDWLRSAQLWTSQTPDLVTRENSPRKVAVVEVGRSGAFHPFKKGKTNKDGGSVTTSPREAPSISPPAAATDGGAAKKDDKEGQAQRKARRCWSPELHRRFVQALQQLGGSHAATPKQIRELMKVDGLTNDEVKSHLQKYRLHTRRPSPTIQSSTANPPPQFAVVVGGIWAMPPEYATVATSGEVGSGVAVASNEICAPVAIKSSNLGSNRGDSGCRDEGASPASSSSSQTTTASPPLC